MKYTEFVCCYALHYLDSVQLFKTSVYSVFHIFYVYALKCKPSERAFVAFEMATYVISLFYILNFIVIISSCGACLFVLKYLFQVEDLVK